MVVVPLILFSIVSGVTGVGSLRGVGRMGIKTICYYMVTSLMAILIGLLMANIIHPGDETLMRLAETTEQPTETAEPAPPAEPTPPAKPSTPAADFVAAARAAKDKGKVKEAIRLLEEGLAKAPNNASAHYVLAWLYVKTGQTAKAIASFQKVVALSPESKEGKEAKKAVGRLRKK